MKYSDYNQRDFPTHFISYSIDSDGELNYPKFYFLEYDENSEIKSLIDRGYSLDSGYEYKKTINGSEGLKILGWDLYLMGSEAGTTSFEYDESGNLKSETNFTPYYDPATIIKEYEYNIIGEVITQTRILGTEGEDIITTEFVYNSNYSLDKVIETKTSDIDYKKVSYFDETERHYKDEIYVTDFLKEIIITNADWSRNVTIFDEDGSYFIKFYDPNQRLLKTEYYDSDGNLISTETH
ncbi:hypothetical protein ML462_02365 [Gramella lutea]|uniref:Uncharacterized protein n=1 Tax=Christiangramia lutea TaxID=1607951 RepID=A0A9X1V0T9_9FLAO|nr:hypothetical protein [Christiangramia lutea]MCH4822004.1 hypothetical protein [Christiangramia lutea]